MPKYNLRELLNGLPVIATHFFDTGFAEAHHGLRDDGAGVIAADAAPSPSGAHDGHAGAGADDGDVGRDGETEIQTLAADKHAVRVDLLNNNNSQYYGDVTLGTPRQRFTAIFDTGSGTTWVPGSSCTSDTCNEHHRFAPHDSRAFAAQPAGDSQGAIHYGTGEVKYEGGRDTLAFCDSHDNAGCHGDVAHRLQVPDHPFGMSTEQTTYPFRILPFDGILGLSPSGNEGSVLHGLKAAKALVKNIFGVYLSEDTHRTGSITFGGIEPAHIAPHQPLNWHKIRNPLEWNVSMKDILVNGKPLHLCEARKDGLCPTVVDTGSSLITGPTGEIEKLLAKIRTSETCDNVKTMPEISIQLQDKDGNVVSYPLTPDEYTLRTLEEVPGSGDTGYLKEFPILGGDGATAPDITNRCDPGIGVMDVPGRKWVLGNTFLRRYYSIYDDDHGAVGFVRSIHPDEAVPTHPPASASTPSRAGAAALLGPAALVPWMREPRQAHAGQSTGSSCCRARPGNFL